MKRANNQLKLKTFRRELRNNLTPAEAKMWTYLKNKQLEGRRFRRQHSIAGFILDFYCPSERLAIELDGQGHFNYGAREYDRERDLFLKYYGVLVLRFVNSWVFDNPHGVLKQIQEHFGWTQKTPSPLRRGELKRINPSGLRPPPLRRGGAKEKRTFADG